MIVHINILNIYTLSLYEIMFVIIYDDMTIFENRKNTTVFL